MLKKKRVVKKKGPPKLTLDQQVAVEILGWKWMRFYDLHYWDPDSSNHKIRRTICKPGTWLDFPDNSTPKYVECDLTNPEELALEPFGPYCAFSSDMGEAAEVIEVMANRGYTLSLSLYEGEWLSVWEGRTGRMIGESASSLPMAICLSALSMVRHHHAR